MTYERIREIALEFPGLEEGTSFGTPSLRVRGKFLARLSDDGKSLVLKMEYYERKYLMEEYPDVFYITDHYRDWPAVLIRLANVSEEQLRARLEDAWRAAAPKRVVADYDKQRAASPAGS